MVFLRSATVLFLAILLMGCSTLKGWFTPQGQKFAQAQTLAKQGHPLGASALAVEALVLEPTYEEAQKLLQSSFYQGQQEFQDSEGRWTNSTDPARWDRLNELYGWQNTLARDGSKFGAYRVDAVDDKLKESAAQASQYHFSRARELLTAVPGPRQARKALAEGRVARAYAIVDGLEDWLDSTRSAATQKVMVIPFFSQGTSILVVSGPLGSRISRKLIDDAGLPELTTIFPSDRLVTLPGGGAARLGLVSQPDALKLAEEGGQNIVLLGQMTRVDYSEPRATTRAVVRERKAVLVDPAHPDGVEKVYRATITAVTWTTKITIGASFTLIEVPTGNDLASASREARSGDETTLTSFTGDREALTSDDLQALAFKTPLRDADSLWSEAFESLAGQIASVVKDGLK